MEREYQTEEVRAVWEALRKVFSEKRTGCTARDIASATGLSEEVVRACLEYLKQEGKVERAGEIYAPASKAAEVKSDVAMTARRYGTGWPAAMPGREMRFAGQRADQWSKEDKEAVYQALVAAYRERGGPVTVGEVAAKARGVGSMQKIGEILRALEDDNRVERGRDPKRANVEVWEPK
jgi:predicted ArsR family transcriptional regulator